jgi:hypothetical protein
LRVRTATGLLFPLLAVLAGCWADFPDSRFNQDATSQPDQPRVHDAVLPADAPLPADGGDGSPPDGPVSEGPPVDQMQLDKAPDGFTCPPNTFVDCATQTLMLKCNAAGNGTVQVNCSPGKCVGNLGRCDQCDPTDPPTCVSNVLETCTADGIKQTTTCPLGCQAGKCCTDGDSDSYTTCNGDCNDNDPLVNPDQNQFQTTASNGSFDYNCDGTVEKQYPDLADCQVSGGTCVGDGWDSQVPDCGDSGSFASCYKKAASCDKNLTTVTQGCR